MLKTVYYEYGTIKAYRQFLTSSPQDMIQLKNGEMDLSGTDAHKIGSVFRDILIIITKKQSVAAAFDIVKRITFEATGSNEPISGDSEFSMAGRKDFF
jgi:predicted metal-dependent enzyme (double-stranded beta helix superfamily)